MSAPVVATAPLPAVVERCTAGLHTRRVYADSRQVSGCCVYTHLPETHPDAQASSEAWLHACWLLQYALGLVLAWFRTRRPDFVMPSWVTPDNADDIAAAAFTLRDDEVEGSTRWQTLHEFAHAACALQTFQNARRRGLLDEVALRVHRVTRHAVASDMAWLVREHWARVAGGWR